MEKLQSKQKKSVDQSCKLSIKDMKRLHKNMIGNPFSKSSKCCKWSGYIYNNKGSRNYVRFSVNGKRLLLQRVLYANYRGSITNNNVYFTCNNTDGTCCSIYHLSTKRPVNKKCVKENDAVETEKQSHVETEIISIQQSVRISFD